jgi:AcrR family transcriptional regulator
MSRESGTLSVQCETRIRGDFLSDEEQIEDVVETGNRRVLVLAAYNRIATDGFEGLRTRDVAADAGVNIGTLHYYFPSKELLIQAVVRYTSSRFAATLSGSGTATERLRRHLEGVRHLLLTDQQLWSTASEVGIRAGRDPVIGEVVQHGNTKWFQFMSNLIAQGVAEGGLTSNLHPERVASVLISAIKGASLPSASLDRAERIEQTFDQLEEWLGFSQSDPM